MFEDHYPTIDIEFFLNLIRKSPKIDPSSEQSFGTSYSFNKIGDQPLYKRQIILRPIDGQFTYLRATGLAAVLGFMGDLLIWLEKNRNWKDGAYISK